MVRISLFKQNLVSCVLFCGLAIVLTLCSPETPPPVVGYPALVGTWKLTQKTVTTDSAVLVKTISDVPAQTITFESDGAFSSQGNETNYYRSARYYKVDSTQGRARLGFIPGSVFAAYYQDFTLKSDSLVLHPCAGDACDLVFLKRR